MDKNINLQIIHTHWNDKMLIINDIYLFRDSNNEEKGKFLLKDNLLIIYWEKWEKEYFFKLDNIFYLLCPKFIHDYALSYFDITYLITETWNETCIIDIQNKKIYKKETLEDGLIENYIDCIDNKINNINNNLIKIFWTQYQTYELFIFFNNKYYNYTYFLSNYEIINIYPKNNTIFLDKKTAVFYKNNNFLDNGIYNKYKNCLALDEKLYMTICESSSNKIYFNCFLYDKTIIFSNDNKFFIRYLNNNNMYDDNDINKSSFKDQNNNYILIDNYKFKSSIIHDKLEYYESLDNNQEINDILKTIYIYLNQENDYVKTLFLDNQNNLYDSENNFFEKYSISISNQINQNFYLYDNSNNKYYENLDVFFKNINKQSNLFVNNNENISYLVNFIDYLKYIEKTNENNKSSYILDNIANFDKNKIYYDLDIIYYHTKDDYEKIINYFNNSKIYYDNELEEDNFLNKINLNLQEFHNNENIIISESIPKIMHFIWLGSNKIPDIYLLYIESWLKNHHDWTFAFWNDYNIPQLFNQEFFDKAETMAMKADILRYELLYFYGGVYVDCDFLSFKNIDELLIDIDGFSGYESDEFIAIGLMGFKKYDNILYHIIKNIGFNLIKYGQNSDIPLLTGPKYMTKLWNNYKTENHRCYEKKYFYSYTFQEKKDNINYTVQPDNYAIHMWGHSWGDESLENNKINIINKNNNTEYFIKSLYLSGKIIENDSNKNTNNINNINEYLRSKIFFNSNMNNFKNKLKIVNIMGVFFTGGIERFMSYIDKYGDHDKYQYYLLIMNDYGEGPSYKINNIKMISYQNNYETLNSLLTIINPNYIVDHLSFYIDANDNTLIYKNINKSKILYFLHSAILYKNDISKLGLSNCIHLYNEIEKHQSWIDIPNNYYMTLGCELNNTIAKKAINKKGEKIKISIVGRVTEEKLPISFFKELVELSNKTKFKSGSEIHIYGAKDNIFNKKYVEEFEKLIKSSSIIYHSFVNPENINSIYLNTDLLLIPSIYETGSFTCIEAFSYGIPVIARNVFGLKTLIQHGINGYLCKDDKEILKIISNLKKDKILANHELIQNNAQKYDIRGKISDYENIIINIDNGKKNLVIITSVINCVKDKLSYIDTRSVFSVKERYKQTLKSIESIREKMPQCLIFFCECSNMKENESYESYEKNIMEKVDYYSNLYSIETIRNAVNSEYKGYGEASMLLKAFDVVRDLEKGNELLVKNIFKLSGRYFLNQEFKLELFDNFYNNYVYWDNSTSSLCSIFYKINSSHINLFKECLEKSLIELQNNSSIEMCMYKYFNSELKILDKLNVSGFLATEGYLFHI